MEDSITSTPTAAEPNDAQPAETQTAPKTAVPAKPTAFSMFEDFCQKVRCVYIDGQLHWLSPGTNYYRPVIRSEIENHLLTAYYSDVRQSGSLRIVKTCADLIMRSNFIRVPSADSQLILCFQNGWLSIAGTENTAFSLGNPPYTVFPTYRICANGSPTHGNWEYMKTVHTPWMDYYLATVSNGNPQIITRIWQMIGYLLTPDPYGKCFFILQGVPNSGKSVLGNLIKLLLSDHRIASLDIDQLGKRTATSTLLDKSINISMDLPNKTLSPLAIRNIKLMTGNDEITVEHKNGTLERCRSRCKFLFATNHPLTLKGTDDGLEERIVCIPFTVSIPPAKQIYNLMNKLCEERDNIVGKALAHYRDLRMNGYVFSGSHLDICKPKIRYLPTDAEDIDAHLCQFVEERCEFVSQERGVYTEELYNAYRRFCKEKGETPIDNIAAFSRRLLRCYSDRITKKKWRRGDHENRWGFRGILLIAISPIT